MSDPIQENAAPQRQVPRPDAGPTTGDAGRQRQAESRRRWKEQHPDRVREQKRRWRQEHLDDARRSNRESMRRAAARKQRQDEVRARSRERARIWREEHPGRNREYQRRWVEQNRDKIREYYRRYYDTHRDQVNARAIERRDADPDRAKQWQKEWAEQNKDRRAEWQRTRRSDPEIYQAELESNAAARRLKRRLAQSGLPPKALHTATAAERRSNERDANDYFSDQQLSEHLRQLTVFGESLIEQILQHGPQMREFAQAYVAARARMDLPSVPVETIVYARAVEIVAQRMRRTDLLTSRDVAAAVRSSQAEVPRIERQEQFDALVKAVVAHVHRYRVRLGNDAKMETRARAHRGKQPIPTESLVVQLAMQEVAQRVPTSRLTVDDARDVARIVGLHVASTLDTRRAPVGASVQGRTFG